MKIKFSKKSISLYVIEVAVLMVLISASNASSIDTNEELDEDFLNSMAYGISQYPVYKRNLDKFRYFGAIGKRNFDNNLSDDESNEGFLNKIRFINSMKKRQFQIEKQRPLLMKKSRGGQIDKYRYLGSIGKK